MGIFKNKKKADGFSVAERKALLSKQNIFSAFTSEQLDSLAEFAEEIKFAAKKEIVHEGDTVDSLMLMVEGRAEVFQKKQDNAEIPLAVLQQDDLIGFNEQGFFSKTGERTATVRAIVPVTVLSISLENFQKFSEKYSDFPFSQQVILKQIRELQFLRKVLPFSHLSTPHLHWLSQKIQKKIIKPGQLIFKQNDSPDLCYFINHGEVEIFRSDENEEKSLAILKEGDVFGELAIIADMKRNASARALKETEVLILSKENLLKLLTFNQETVTSLRKLLLERSRPKKNENIEVYDQKTADQEKVVILKEPIEGNYFRLSEFGWFIWEQLDGRKTLKDITMAFYEKYNVFSPEKVLQIVFELAQANFVTMPTLRARVRPGKLPFWVKAFNVIKDYAEYQHVFTDVDTWLTRFYNRFLYLFCTRSAQWGFLFLIMIGLIMFGYNTPRAADSLSRIDNGWLLLLLLLPISIFSVPLHELGHASATKAFGRKVHAFGVGWMWISAIAYSDTSDMWLGTRWQRIVVSLAGIYADIILASIFSIAAFFSHSDFAVAFLWIVSLSGYLSLIRNMNPMFEYDGYYVLMDLLNRPNLRESAFLWAAEKGHETLRHPSNLKNYIPEIIYWLVCFGYIALVTAVTYYLQLYLISSLLPEPYRSILVSGHYQWILPLIMFFLSLLAVVAENRRFKAELHA